MLRSRPSVVVLAAACALLSSPSFAEEGGLPFAAALARRRATGGEAEVAALVAEARSAAAGGGSLAAAGPSVALTAGPRQREMEGSTGDFAVEVEVPLATARGARAALARSLEAEAEEALAGARALAAADLAVAFADAWLAQATVTVREEDLAATDEWLALARRRVEAGADPPYEPVLVAGERDRSLVELVAARREAELAWGELAARTELGTEPQPLTLAGLADAAGRMGPGDRPALAGIDARRRLETALAQARSAAAGRRWALASEVASEGDERLAHLGVAYRIPLRGERRAVQGELAAAQARATRAAEAQAAAVRARAAAARSALGAARPAVEPGDLDRARSALTVRIAEGKERPSDVLPLRRQLLEARLAAFAAEALRARAAAELAFLTGGPPHAR
jgi:outer membrane protein TolC